LQKTTNSPKNSDIPDLKYFSNNQPINNNSLDFYPNSLFDIQNTTRFDEIKIVSPSNKLESTREKKLKDEIKECVIFQNKGIQQKCQPDAKVNTHINQQFLSNFMRKRENQNARVFKKAVERQKPQS